jgi:hypothetical protein
MPNTPCPVSTCDRPRRGDQPICGACAEQLRHDLEAIPALSEDLDLALSRQTAMGGGGGGDKPLPYSVRASDAGALLRDTLTDWLRVVLAGMPAVPAMPEGPRCLGVCSHGSCLGIGRVEMLVWFTAEPDATVPAIARWMAARRAYLLRHPAVTDIVEEIAVVVEAASRTVDRPGERQYAGPCPACGEGLYAKTEAVQVACRGCGEVQRMGARRDFLLSELRGTLATASQAAHILTQLLDNGAELKPRTVRNWAFRARIVAHGHDERGRPLYEVGECEELFVAELRRQAERDAKVAS